MVEIPEVWQSVLNTLIAAPIAWQSPAQIAGALGRDVVETNDLLCEIDLAGWLAVWDGGVGPVVTLSALAAHRLQVVLVEAGPEETPRWAPAGTPLPAPPRAKHVARSEYHARQAYLLDPDPSPDIAAERAERAERRAARAARIHQRRAAPLRDEDLPVPCLFLGQGLSPWPGPAEFARADSCPACGNHALKPHMYCLGCDRWGLDDLLASVAKTFAARQRIPRPASAPAPAPASPSTAPHERVAESHRIQQENQHERTRRKARRKARRAAQG